MNKTQVINLLKSHKNEAGMEKWDKRLYKKKKLKSFGIGLTVLRKLAKQIGRDRKLALQLWESNIYDAKIIALLIDEPKQITIAQAEEQVEQVDQGHLAHVFSSCNASLAKTPFVAELAQKWIESKDPTRRRCSYGLIYELSKSKKKSAPDNDYFLACVNKIQNSYAKEEQLVLLSMGGALMGIGKRNVELNKAALKLAKEIGPIAVESENGQCDPFDVVKHLTSDYLKEKLQIK